MGVIGKIIGGTVGFALGGPLGMVAGIAFGNLFDRAKEYTRPISEQPLSQSEQSEALYFVALFSMLGKMAMADGRLLEEERKVVDSFIYNDLKLDRQSGAFAQQVFLASLSSQGTFEQYAQQFYQNFSAQQPLVETMIDILVRVALADGRISSAEDALLTRAATIFGISQSLLHSIKERYGGVKTSSSKAYATLGLTSSATNEEIKKAYRKRSIEFHPPGGSGKREETGVVPVVHHSA